MHWMIGYFTAPRFSCPVHVGIERYEQIDGLATDSHPGAGPLQYKPQDPSTARSVLLRNVGLATRTRLTQLHTAQLVIA